MDAVVRSMDELAREASRFVSALSPLPAEATLVTLSGDLGAGKTAFTQAAARALGIEESVTSPTFVLEKIYELEGAPFKRLVHIDAYRLEGPPDLAALGFDELMKEPMNLIFLEWPERVGSPAAAARVALHAEEDGARTITYGS